MTNILAPTKPDLNCAEHIDQMVVLFYMRIFNDAQLQPVFEHFTSLPITEHLPIISLYWQKMLLGDTRYQRHTMNIHRQLHQRRPLSEGDFERWLQLFNTNLSVHFCGPYTDKASTIAGRIIHNMQKQL